MCRSIGRSCCRGRGFDAPESVRAGPAAPFGVSDAASGSSTGGLVDIAGQDELGAVLVYQNDGMMLSED
jgi:hypothetical protein